MEPNCKHVLEMRKDEALWLLLLLSLPWGVDSPALPIEGDVEPTRVPLVWRVCAGGDSAAGGSTHSAQAALAPLLSLGEPLASTIPQSIMMARSAACGLPPVGQTRPAGSLLSTHQTVINTDACVCIMHVLQSGQYR